MISRDFHSWKTKTQRQELIIRSADSFSEWFNVWPIINYFLATPCYFDFMLLSKNILKFFELIKTESFVDETEANDPNVHIKLSDKVGLLGETHGASQVVLMVKNLPAMRRLGFHPWVRKIPWGKKWQPTPVFSPGEFRGQRSLAGYSPTAKSWTWLKQLGPMANGDEGSASLLLIISQAAHRGLGGPYVRFWGRTRQGVEDWKNSSSSLVWSGAVSWLLVFRRWLSPISLDVCQTPTPSLGCPPWGNQRIS